jgi:probable F420-dependent oxidoreductase
MMICNDYRHPAVLAKEAATLAMLSGGRFELGIGAGWMRSDYEESGITMDPPGTRVSRLAEAVSVIKSFFADDVVSFDGDHYKLSDLAGRPKVRPEWAPRVMIGGGGRRVLSLAARQADIVAINASLAAGLVGNSIATGVTASITDEKLSWVRQAAGERFDALELATTLSRVILTDDRDAGVRMLAPTLGLSPAELLECPHVLIGSTDQMVETLLERRERWGISYVVAVGDGRHQLAPVVSRLAGK